MQLGGRCRRRRRRANGLDNYIVEFYLAFFVTLFIHWVVSCLQVNVVQLKPLQAIVNGSRYVLDIRDDLGRHEEFFSSHFALFDGMADLVLGIVDLGSI